MKRISTVLGAAVALTLLAGCAGNGNDGRYYGSGYGYSGTRAYNNDYRQPYPGYRYNGDDRYRGNYNSRVPYYYDRRNYYRR